MIFNLKLNLHQSCAPCDTKVCRWNALQKTKSSAWFVPPRWSKWRGYGWMDLFSYESNSQGQAAISTIWMNQKSKYSYIDLRFAKIQPYACWGCRRLLTSQHLSHDSVFFFNTLRGRKKCINFCCYHLFRPQHKINKKVLQLSRTLLRNEGCTARAAVGTGLRSASVVKCSCMALPTYMLQFELCVAEASRKVLAK